MCVSKRKTKTTTNIKLKEIKKKKKKCFHFCHRAVISVYILLPKHLWQHAIISLPIVFPPFAMLFPLRATKYIYIYIYFQETTKTELIWLSFFTIIFLFYFHFIFDTFLSSYCVSSILAIITLSEIFTA